MGIKLLSKEVINQIAAGEVVERPASVLKEAIENSIDANATSIKVVIKNAGIDQILVEDNGSGIPIEDAELVFEQHATSKVEQIEDFETLATNGFRGEALASIAEIAAAASIESYKSGSTPFAYTYKKAVKEIKKSTPGTTLIIEGLFDPIPARKKFLKTKNTEFRHIQNTVKNLAIAHHAVGFELIHDSKTIYKLPPAKKKLDRIYEIWDLEKIKNITGAKAELPELKIEGFFGNSSIAYSGKGEQYVFVNGRYVTTSILHAAIRNAYSGFIPSTKKPTFILFVDVPPRSVDVNIHPRKLEVKFSNEQDIFLKTMNFAKKHLESTQIITNDTIADQRTSFSTQSSRSIGNLQPKRNYTDNSAKGNKGLIKQSIEFSKELKIPNQKRYETDYSNQNNKNQTPEYKNQYQIIGLLFEKYILIEQSDFLCILDIPEVLEQKTLHLIKQSQSLESQTLLLPESLDLEKTQFEFLSKNLESLSKLGILLEPFGTSGFQLIEVPKILALADWSELVVPLAQCKKSDEFPQVIAKLSRNTDALALTNTKWQEELASFALTNNVITKLTKDEISKLTK